MLFSNSPTYVPLLGELSVTCDGDYAASDDVGFTVYRGHPYCEACHVRLRMPKCKRCKRSIRDGDKAVEALGGKWCWECFVCKVGLFRCCFFHVKYEDVGSLMLTDILSFPFCLPGMREAV